MQAEDAGSLGEKAEALLLDAALENIPYGFGVWSPQFRLVMWNKNWRDIYGFSRAIALGTSLGMATTTEGVETEEQLALVRLDGATEVQGFLFSPPLSSSMANLLHSEVANRQVARKKAS